MRFTHWPVIRMAYLLDCSLLASSPSKQVYDKYIPLVAIASPILCYILQRNSEAWLNGYQISYELLIINALFTFLGLCLFIKRQDKETSYTTHTTKQK